MAADELAEAEHTGQEALALMRLENYAAWLFDPLGLLAALRGRWWEAAWLLGHGDAAREADRIPREPTEAMAYERAMALLRTELGDERLAQALAHGRSLGPADADGAGEGLARPESRRGIARPRPGRARCRLNPAAQRAKTGRAVPGLGESGPKAVQAPAISAAGDLAYGGYHRTR